MTAEACVLSLFAGYGGLDQALEEVLNVTPVYVSGWITSVPGVTHAEALKMCGNGVVPAQAALAIRICLDRARSEAAA